MKRSELFGKDNGYSHSWLSWLHAKRPKLDSIESVHSSVYERLFKMKHRCQNKQFGSCDLLSKHSSAPAEIFNPALDSAILHPAPLSNYSRPADRVIPSQLGGISASIPESVNPSCPVFSCGPFASNAVSNPSTTHTLTTAPLGLEHRVYKRMLSEAASGDVFEPFEGWAEQPTIDKKITIIIDDTTDEKRTTGYGIPSVSTNLSVQRMFTSLDLGETSDDAGKQFIMANTANNSETANSWIRRCKEAPYLSDTWLKSLSTRYETKAKRWEFQRQLTEAKLCHWRRQVAMTHQQRMDSLEQRLTCLLLTPPVLNDPYLEPQPIPIELPYKKSIVSEPKTAVLPVLTEAQLASINNALKAGSSNAVLVDMFRLSVTRRELLTLTGTNWLSDMVINFYMQLLSARSNQLSAPTSEKRSPTLPRLAVFSTFFYAKLTSSTGGGYAGVRRWSRQLKVFDQDLILIPIHDRGMHWCLTCVDMGAKTITYYDSMGSANSMCLCLLKQYLLDEHVDKKGGPLPDPDAWKLINSKDTVPQQFNGSDCGVFMCTFGEFLSRRVPFSFSQDDMPSIRQRMIFEILNQRLLTTDFHLIANSA